MKFHCESLYFYRPLIARPSVIVHLFPPTSQRAPNPPEFAQPRLSRSNGGHPQREGTNLGVFVPIWLVLLRCEATNQGVFDLCHISRLPLAGHNKASRTDFRNQRFEPDTGKMRKMQKVPLAPERQGLRRSPQSENAENVEMRTRKRRKCGKCG